MTEARHARDSTALPLRARKRLRARTHAASVASRLFSERGYEQTSLEDIAEEAEMSVSSLLRYFGSKERLALAHHLELLEAFRAKLADESLTVIGRWRAFIAEQAGSLLPYSAYHAERKLIVSFPVLLRLLSRIQLDQQEELTAAFAREAGLDPDHDLYGRLLAALLVAGNEAVYIQWLRSGGKADLVEVSLEVVDFVAARLGTRHEATQQVPSIASAAGDAGRRENDGLREDGAPSSAEPDGAQG